MDLINENNKGGEKKKAKCPQLYNDDLDWTKLYPAFTDIHKENGFKLGEDGVFTFNSKDISSEAKMLTDAFVNSNWRQFGFLLGDTLVHYATQHNEGAGKINKGKMDGTKLDDASTIDDAKSNVAKDEKLFLY